MTDAATLPLADRLLKGAKVLGALWRDGLRCASGWEGACTDAGPTAFCKAKNLWLQLAEADGRWLAEPEVGPNTPFATVLLMTPAEFVATGLTLTVELPELGKVKVGPKGDVPWSVFAMGRESLATVLSVLRAFPKSKVIA